MIAMGDRGKCVDGWVTKITLKKSTDVFDFFGAIFVTHRGPVMIVMGGGERAKIAAEKIKPTFLIFLARFSSLIEGLAMIAMERGSV